MEKTLDVCGLQCPLPVLKARKVLLAMPEGSLLHVSASDPMAAIDMPHFCAQAGHSLISSATQGETLHFTIRRGPGP